MVRPPKTYQAPCPLGRLGVPCFSLYRLTVFHFPDRLLAYCVMPTHWHLMFWPWEDGELSRFMAWVTLTHTQR
jgi:hypothetical protein